MGLAKFGDTVRHAILWAVAFFVTLVGLSSGYAALVSGLSNSDKTNSGSGLSSVSWNRIVDAVLQLDSRTAEISASGANVWIGTINPRTTLDVAGGNIAYDNTGTIWRAAATGMCAGILATGAAGYGQLQVLKSNGVSCSSACDAISTNSGPYTKYYCYGSVDASAISHVDKAANNTVGGGWYGYGYCGGTNGMSTYCCCHSNFDNTR